MKQQSGLLEAEQTSFLTNAGLNWQRRTAEVKERAYWANDSVLSCFTIGEDGSMWQQWHYKTNRQTWQWLIVLFTIFTAICCDINISTSCHFRHVPTEKCRWLLCPHTVSGSVAKTKQFCVVRTNHTGISSPVWTDTQDWCLCKTCFLSTCSPARLEPLPTVCHKASQGTTTKLPIIGFEVDGSINTKRVDKIMQTPHKEVACRWKNPTLK